MNKIPFEKIEEVKEEIRKELELSVSRTTSAMLFLGNGFDLSCGYRVCYNDFYNSYEFQEQVRCGSDLCNSISNMRNNELWSDLECGLYNYSKYLTTRYGEGDSFMADKFKKEFRDLKFSLLNYLNRMQKTSVEGINTMQSLFDIWSKLHPQIVTFNYTNITAASVNDASVFGPQGIIRPEKMIYQHGMIYNTRTTQSNGIHEIVLGIDDSQKVEEMHSFLYKSRQKRFNIDRLFHDMDAKRIYVIYGCSIGDSDKTYFSHLFGIEKENKIYLIYGHGEEKLKELESKIDCLTSGLDGFKKNNRVEFINSRDMCENVCRKTYEILCKTS